VTGRRRVARLLVAAVFAASAGTALALDATDDAQAQRATQQATISRLVAVADYARVQKMADRLLASRARFADGLWRLSFLYGQFGQAMTERFKEDAQWERAQKRLLALAKRRPMALLLVHEAFAGQGHVFRGTGYASSVPPASWQAFRDLVGGARTMLDAHKAVLSPNPAWYSLRISDAVDLGEDPVAARRLFDEGRQRHPTYHAIYFARLREVIPAWGGSVAQIVDLLDEAARSGPAATAEGVYARLLWAAEGYDVKLIYDARIDDAAFRASVDGLIASYPDPWNVQKMFWFACQRSDRALAARLLGLIRGPPLPEIWKDASPSMYPMLVSWADGREQAVVISEHDRDGNVTEHLLK
jgi:hypothetical protein